MHTSLFLKSITGALLFGAVSVGQAATLVDSINGTVGTTDGFIDYGKALVFRTGGADYSLESAQVTFRHNGGAAVPNITGAIFSSTTTGNLRPSASLATFSIPTITSGTTASYTLSLSSALTLAADTNYFFVLYASTSNVFWMYTASTPTSAVGYSFPDVNSGSAGVQYGWFGTPGTVSNPAVWTDASGTYNDLVLNGSVIPEPSSVLLLSAVAGFGMVRRRR